MLSANWRKKRLKSIKYKQFLKHFHDYFEFSSLLAIVESGKNKVYRAYINTSTEATKMTVFLYFHECT